MGNPIKLKPKPITYAKKPAIKISPAAKAAPTKARPTPPSSNPFPLNPVPIKTNPVPIAYVNAGGTPHDLPAAAVHVRSRAEILAEQRFLQHKGYKIADDGVEGVNTQAAAENWRNTHGKGVSTFNAKHAPSAPPARTKNNQTKAGTSPGNANGNVPSPDKAADAATLPDPGVGKMLSGEISQILRKINAPLGTVPLSGLPSAPAVPVANAVALAKRLADTQYGGAIRETKHEQAVLTRQAPQNISDIKSWYNQTAGSLEGARAADAKAAEMATKEVGGATAGIVSALGGAANEGAGAVGAAGTTAAALLAGLGQVQANYQSNATGQLSLERAGQLLRQTRLDQTRQDTLAQALAEQEHQRGNVQATAEQDITQQNFANKMTGFNASLASNSAEMAARTFNQGLKQQQIGNLESIPALQIAAATADPEILATLAKANSVGQPTAYQQFSARERVLTRQAKASKSLREQQTKVNQAISEVIGSTRKVKVTAADGTKTERVEPVIAKASDAVRKALAIAQGSGLNLTNPAVRMRIKTQVRSFGHWSPQELEAAWRSVGYPSSR